MKSQPLYDGDPIRITEINPLLAVEEPMDLAARLLRIAVHASDTLGPLDGGSGDGYRSASNYIVDWVCATLEFAVEHEDFSSLSVVLVDERKGRTRRCGDPIRIAEINPPLALEELMDLAARLLRIAVHASDTLGLLDGGSGDGYRRASNYIVDWVCTTLEFAVEHEGFSSLSVVLVDRANEEQV